MKEDFKSLLFDSLTRGGSFENLSYLSRCSLSKRCRFRRIRSNVLRGIESDLAYKKVSGVVSQYILQSGNLWQPLSSSMVKNKHIFSLVISKLMLAFTLWLYNLIYPTILSTNISSKNNSKSMRGVTISSSLLLNFEMFADSTTLTSRFSHFISKAVGFW